MTQPAQPGTEIEVGLTLSPELVQVFAQMAMMIPGETTDAYDSIVGAILSASSWEQLSDPWESSAIDEVAGKTLLLQTVKRRPSDYRDGLGIFLVIGYTDVKTGESKVWTTGSIACVAQMAKAYASGWLPLYAEVVVAARQTEAGYRPYHLKFTGKPSLPQAERMPF